MMVERVDQALSLSHLQRLTDCTGIVQHANYALPDYRSGYTTDDNARALVVAVRHCRLYRDEVSRELAARYLAFIMYAARSDGRFHNFIAYDRRPLDEVGSEDCFGRAVTALAWVLADPPQPGLDGPADRMLQEASPWIPRLEHPRGRAFALLALHQWSRARPAEVERFRELARPLADYLVRRFREHSRPGWDWILPEMTYSNAKLPEALFRAYQITGSEEYLEVALRSMEFLASTHFEGDSLRLVGNGGWYPYDSGEAPFFDQQPVDAADMVDASLAAFDATGDTKWLRRAWVALEWFFGRNSLGVSLYDADTGGCFDGITQDGVNRNRGAESTICLLLSQLSVLEARQTISRRMLNMPPSESLLR
ncbi:MAG: glycosyltransferase [Armatimonadota bacterium]